MSGFAELAPSLQQFIVNTLGWKALRPLQEEAVEPILAGQHALLGAPTAGGKTEAAIFPLITRMNAERWGSMSVLYVCPLRALVNNLTPRLEQYLEGVGRTAAMWHGDIDDAARQRIRKDPPDLLVTTPESLESMLVSPRVDERTFLGGVRAIVIDEVHAFAGDDRGWHLLAVLARLEALTGAPIQRIGLSATIGNADELLTWLSGGAGGAVVMPDAETTPPEYLVDFVGTHENAAQVIAQLHPHEKRLVFADSRSVVERLSNQLRRGGTTTHVSHSSLSRGERQRAEEAFATGDACVIVSTSALELGIDVGDLDRVYQVDAPATVASTLQRMGRTGRRPGTTRNLTFFTTVPESVVHAAALVQLARRGWVEPVVPPPLPAHVLAQQLLARVLSEGRVGQSDWPGPLQAFCKQAQAGGAARAVPEHALQADILIDQGGAMAMGPTGEELFGRRHFMDVLSVFLTPPLFVARHGRIDVGFIDPTALLHENGVYRPIVLAGRTWDPVEVDWRRKVVSLEPTTQHGRIRWPGGGAARSRIVCAEMRAILVDPAGIDDTLTKRARSQLLSLQSEFAWLVDGHTGVVRDESRSEVTWWNFAGGKAQRQFAAGLRASGLDVKGLSDISITVRNGPSPNAVRAALDSMMAAPPAPEIPDEALEDVKFWQCVPEPLLRSMLDARWRDDEAVRSVLAEPVSWVS